MAITGNGNAVDKWLNVTEGLFRFKTLPNSPGRTVSRQDGGRRASPQAVCHFLQPKVE